MASQLRGVYIPTLLNVSRHKFSEIVVMAVSALVIQIDNCVVLTVPDRARKMPDRASYYTITTTLLPLLPLLLSLIHI